MAGFLTFASLRADELDLTNTSQPLVVYGLTVVICRLVFAKVPDHVPSLPLGAAALAAIGGGLAVAAVWPQPAGLLVGAFVMAVGVAFSTPAFFSAIFATASATERGSASATASILLDLGLGIGPLVLGFVAEPFGIPWAFGSAAIVSMVGVLWVLHLARAGPPTRH
jgi:predicted MFS family arabinose efflux permease